MIPPRRLVDCALDDHGNDVEMYVYGIAVHCVVVDDNEGPVPEDERAAWVDLGGEG